MSDFKETNSGTSHGHSGSFHENSSSLERSAKLVNKLNNTGLGHVHDAENNWGIGEFPYQGSTKDMLYFYPAGNKIDTKNCLLVTIFVIYCF